MKIGIDIRLIAQSGVGRYIRNLLRELAELDTENRYVLFGRSSDEVPLSGSRWEFRAFDTHWHTVAEQLVMPRIFSAASLDVVHIPYFTIPVFYRGPLVATIHDLTVRRVNTGKASTLPYPFYRLRRMGYEVVLQQGLRNVTGILTVSQTTKRDIMASYGIPEDRITVTYEGIDPVFLTERHDTAESEQPFLLYVGNAYPHKHPELVLAAFRTLLRAQPDCSARLVFVGTSDFFYERLKASAAVRELGAAVEFRGAVSDAELLSLYDRATALVFPSEMEGFGLPALEAYARGCPVLCSDIPIFRELLGTAARFIPVGDTGAWSAAMSQVLHRPYRTAVDRQLLRRYSWQSLARETLKQYERCYRIRSRK